MSTQQIIESWENGVEPYNATKADKPKVQYRRKLGHLWQSLYGRKRGRQFYGYGVTMKQATQQAKQRYAKAFPTS